MKILIINPFGIGDVLFTTPLISHLRNLYPDAFIGYVANRRAADIVQSNPKINQVYVYERDEFKVDLIPSWLKFFKDIKSGGFDMVFDFSLNSTFGFFSLVCGIPKRMGYDYKGRGRFLTHKIILKGYEGRHIIEYYLDLAKFIDNSTVLSPAMELVIDQNHQQWAKAWIKAAGIVLNQPMVAIIPGGGASWGKDAALKRWPASQYALLMDKIVAKSKATIILMGDLKEQSLAQELARHSSYPIYDAVGKTTLLQMAALLKLCSVVIVNDGGPLHMAVAAGVKTVSIFGPVDPVLYGPYPLGNHRVVSKGLACQPCYRQFRKAACSHLSCLNQLSVEEVFNQVERSL
jgi:lipopolysaccharide heptosyltransferase II